MTNKILPRFRSGLRAWLATASVAFGGIKAAAETPQQSDVPAPTKITMTQQTLVPQNDARQAGRDFFDIASPLLRRNEGLVCRAYLDSVNKVTIGIGCNIQDTSAIAREMVRTGKIAFLHNSKKMSLAEFDAFIKDLPNKTKAQLKTYTLSEADAIKLSKETFAYMYDRVTNRFAKPDGKLPGIDFEKLPVFLKIAMMDTIFNVGETKFFKTFPKFNKALRTGNYTDAFAQLRLRNIPASRAFRKDALTVCYAVEKMYERDVAQYGKDQIAPNDYIFHLVGYTRSLSQKDQYKPKTGKKKNKVIINATERAAFFSDVADVWANILYPEDTPLQHKVRVQTLKNVWNQMENVYNQEETRRKAAPKVCRTATKQR